MDAARFETILRALATAPSRRALLRLLAGSALGGVLLPGSTPSQAHDARKKCKHKSGKQKKRCRKKAENHTARHNGRRTPGCTLNCAGKVCGDDGCGGSCGVCIGGTCSNGSCVCPAGTKNCGGACFNTGTDPRNCGDCGSRCAVNETCVGGQCRCGSGGRCSSGTCCPTGGCKCNSAPNFTDPATCQDVSSCPTGSTECIGPNGTCGLGLTTRTCCPSGTTCTAEGTCLQ